MYKKFNLLKTEQDNNRNFEVRKYNNIANVL